MSSPMWRILRRHRSPARRSRGQALVELALILPIFLLLIAGAIDLGRLFYAYVAIVNASKEGALYGASNPMCDREKSQCPNPLNVVWHVQTEVGKLRDADGSCATPTVTCLAPGAAPSACATASTGDTYRVAIDFQFRLITPILGSVLDRGLTLHAAVGGDGPQPGVRPEPGAERHQDGPERRRPATTSARRCPTRRPGSRSTSSSPTSEPIQYRIDVVNSGGNTLTGLTLTDDPDGWPATVRCTRRCLSGDTSTATTREARRFGRDGKTVRPAGRTR